MDYTVKSQARDASPLSKTRKTFHAAYLEARMLLSAGEDRVEIFESAEEPVLVWTSACLYDRLDDFEDYMEMLEEGEESMNRLSYALSSEKFWVS